MTIAFNEPGSGASDALQSVLAAIGDDTTPGGFNLDETPAVFAPGDTVPAGTTSAFVTTGPNSTVDPSSFSNLDVGVFSGEGRVEGSFGDGTGPRAFQMSDGGSDVSFGAGPSTVVGGAGDDSIDFTSGAGFAFVGEGNDSVSGGGAFDVVVAPQGTTSFQDGKLVVTGEDGSVSTIDSDVDFVVVGDQVLLNAATNEEAVLARIYEGLYEGFDVAGLAFWEDGIAKGEKTLVDVAAAAVSSPALQNLPADQFVQEMYELFFSRGADTDGLEFWTSALQSGQLDRAALVVGLAASAEMAQLTEDKIFVGGWGDQTM